MAGQDIEAIKAKIKNIVIKTVIASVPTVTSLSKNHCKYRHTCHELFGFDIFLDQHLKPWLIEVSIVYSEYITLDISVSHLTIILPIILKK